MEMKLWLFLPLFVLALYFFRVWCRAIGDRPWRPTIIQVAIGSVTDFFDTLGIGSFATTAALYKLTGQVRDERIPGTMMVGHTTPTMVQACIFMSLVRFEVKTLVLLMAASVAGAMLGTGVVTRLPRQKVQLAVGLALLVSAALLMLMQLRGQPIFGEALGLSGKRLAAGVIGSFVIGSMTSVGVGSYAPSMVLYSLAGLNPLVAFPIMMGSAAFLMPVSSIQFCRARQFEAPAAVGLTLGGIPAVLLAALFVKSLPLSILRWLVLGIVLLAAFLVLRSSQQEPVGVPPILTTKLGEEEVAFDEGSRGPQGMD